MANEATPSTSIIGWAAGRRELVGYVCAGLGAVLALLTVHWGLQWQGAREPAPAEPSAEQKTDVKLPNTGTGDSLPAAVWSGVLAVVAFSGAAWNLGRKAEPDRAPLETRLMFLLMGGLAGLFTALLGFALAWRWQRSILLWVNQGETEEAKWVLAALSILFAGLLLLFFSMQLGRTEERSSALVRRMLYGVSTVLSALLLLLVLAVGNVIAFLKLPDSVITTAAAFKGLSPESKQFLKSIDQPTRVYLILPENYVDEDGYMGLYADCRALLRSCEEANANIKAVYLSPAADADEIRQTQDRLEIPKDLRGAFGMLIGYGETEKPSGTIPVGALLDYNRDGQPIFQGENRLMTELNFLSGGAKRPVVYFTQGNGEYAITPPTEINPRSCSEIVEYLKDRKIDVKPLVLEAGKPLDLTDASMVIIPGPRAPFRPEQIELLRQYLNPPAKGGPAPGKIIAYLPAIPAENGTVASTGLEELFFEFGIIIENRRLLSLPGQGYPPTDVQGTLSPVLRRVQHGLASMFAEDFRIRFGNVRVIETVQTRAPGRMSLPLFASFGGYATYQDTRFNSSPDEISKILEKERQNNSSRTANELRISNQFIPFAAFCSQRVQDETSVREVPRVVAVGTDWLIDDAILKQSTLGPENYKRLFGLLVGWVRERPESMGIEPRAVGVFTLPKETDDFALYFMPLLLLLIGIVGLGLGVWMARRR
jgi:uncharacterized Tic20 family protein